MEVKATGAARVEKAGGGSEWDDASMTSRTEIPSALIEQEIRRPRAIAIKIELPGIHDLHPHVPIVFLVGGEFRISPYWGQVLSDGVKHVLIP
jgi:hypothetical protein